MSNQHQHLQQEHQLGARGTSASNLGHDFPNLPDPVQSVQQPEDTAFDYSWPLITLGRGDMAQKHGPYLVVGDPLDEGRPATAGNMLSSIVEQGSYPGFAKGSLSADFEQREREAFAGTESYGAGGAGDVDELPADLQGTHIPILHMGVTRRGKGAQRAMICMVEACGVDISHLKAYHQRHRLCENHMKAPALIVHGRAMRLCQQCSKFHTLPEFEGAKRTCRMMLDKQRKGPMPGPTPGASSGGRSRSPPLMRSSSSSLVESQYERRLPTGQQQQQQHAALASQQRKRSAAAAAGGAGNMDDLNLSLGLKLGLGVGSSGGDMGMGPAPSPPKVARSFQSYDSPGAHMRHTSVPGLNLNAYGLTAADAAVLGIGSDVDLPQSMSAPAHTRPPVAFQHHQHQRSPELDQYLPARADSVERGDGGSGADGGRLLDMLEAETGSIFSSVFGMGPGSAPSLGAGRAGPQRIGSGIIASGLGALGLGSSHGQQQQQQQQLQLQGVGQGQGQQAAHALPPALRFQLLELQQMQRQVQRASQRMDRGTSLSDVGTSSLGLGMTPGFGLNSSARQGVAVLQELLHEQERLLLAQQEEEGLGLGLGLGLGMGGGGGGGGGLGLGLGLGLGGSVGANTSSSTMGLGGAQRVLSALDPQQYAYLLSKNGGDAASFRQQQQQQAQQQQYNDPLSCAQLPNLNLPSGLGAALAPATADDFINSMNLNFQPRPAGPGGSAQHHQHQHQQDVDLRSFSSLNTAGGPNSGGGGGMGSGGLGMSHGHGAGAANGSGTGMGI